MDFDLAEQVDKLLFENNIDKAIELVENKLSALKKTDFHKIIGIDLKHLAESLSIYIDNFYEKAKKEIKVKAIYSEMNGFTINPDLWYIDLFAFSECGGLDDLDWLSEYEISSIESMTISGFENLQETYEKYMKNERWRDVELKKACEICELLIILRLQELFKESKKIAIENKLNSATIPVFVTAHDYDLVYKVKA